MEKIKNFLVPGKGVDDEIMYGSGTSSDPVHSGNNGTLSGEGSHLAAGRDITTDPSIGGDSNVENVSSTAGPRSSTLADKAVPRMDSDRDGSPTPANTMGVYGRDDSSTMPGGFPSNTASPYNTQDLDPRLGGTTNTVTDLVGPSTTGKGYTATSAAEPKTTGTGTATTSLLGPSTTDIGSTATNEQGLQGQNSAVKIDNDGGRDVAAVGTAGIAAEGIHHHKPNEREILASSGSITGPSENATLVDQSRDTTPGTVGSNVLGSGPNTTANTTGAGVANKTYDNTTYPDTNANTTGAGVANINSDTTSGPHKSKFLNKLDPRVDSTNMQTAGTNATENHYGRDAAAVGGAIAVGEGIHHHQKNEQEQATSSSYPGTTASGAGSSYYGGPAGTAVSDTQGPHSTATANRLDPRFHPNAPSIDADRQYVPLSGPEGTTTGGNNSGNQHHPARDTAVGAGDVGSAEHKHRKHDNDRGMVTSVGTGPISGSRTYDDSQTSTAGAPSSGHHYGRDAAVGAGSVGLAEHEHRKHDNDRELIAGNGTGTGAGITTGTISASNNGTFRDANTPTTGVPGSSYHYGRDAATGAGSVGLAEHENRKHDINRGNAAGTSTGPHSNSGILNDNQTTTGGIIDQKHHSGRDAAVDVGGVGLAENERLKHENETATAAGTTTGTVSDPSAYNDIKTTSGAADSGHHYGRDAAVGAGVVGLAEHEHKKNGQQAALADTSGAAASTTRGTGPAPNTSGPHSKDWMNKLDPRVKSSPDTAATGPTGSHATTDTANESQGMRNRNAYVDPAARDSPGFVSSATHSGQPTHGEQDAIAGSALTGTAGYGAEKHHAAANKQGVSQGVDDANTTKDHNYGRDAAALGTAGVGAHELSKHHKEKELAVEPRSGAVTGNTAGTTTGNTTGLQGKTIGGTQPEVGYGQNTYDQSTGTGVVADQSKDGHSGRGATGAGVVGAGAYEAEKHHKHDKDLTAAEKEQKREAKREEKEIKREHKEEKRHEKEVVAAEREQNREIKQEEKEAKREHKEEKKHGRLLGFLHRDKSKKYTKEEEEEFDRQEREQERHRTRDTAIGGAAVGGAVYEAEKHNHNHRAADVEPDTMKPLPTAPGNGGIGTGEGTQNALIIDRKRGEGYDNTSNVDSGYHYGRDATIVGGTAALGEQEQDENEFSHPHVPGSEQYKPPGTSLGDKMHGVEHNRGINRGASEIPAGGYGADQTGITPASGRTATGTSNLGRDTAVGAGELGFTEHEHRKHEQDGSTRIGNNQPIGTAQYSPSDGSALGSSTTNASHVGRDTAVGTGGVGVAEHEHRKHEQRSAGILSTQSSAAGTTQGSSGMDFGTNDPGTNLLGDTTQPERTAAYSFPPAPKHNVLHKDPPPNHPAAALYRNDGAGTGQQSGLDRSGATNPPGMTGDGKI